MGNLDFAKQHLSLSRKKSIAYKKSCKGFWLIVLIDSCPPKVITLDISPSEPYAYLNTQCSACIANLKLRVAQLDNFAELTKCSVMHAKRLFLQSFMEALIESLLVDELRQEF